jgi:hypothetical protein
MPLNAISLLEYELDRGSVSEACTLINEKLISSNLHAAVDHVHKDLRRRINMLWCYFLLTSYAFYRNPFRMG